MESTPIEPHQRHTGTADDERRSRPRRSTVGVGPGQRRAVRLGRVGRRQCERSFVAGRFARRPQPIDSAGDRELGRPEPIRVVTVRLVNSNESRVVNYEMAGQ